MKQRFLDRDDNANVRRAIVDRARCQQPRIVGDASGAVDAERLVHAGHQEQQTDLWVDEQVGHSVEPIVTTRSGSSSVRSSSTRTKPAGSPRGEMSAPLGP